MESMNAEDIKGMYDGFGGEWQDINIFGIRVNENPNSDEFNDFIGVVCGDIYKIYKGTTDPGIYYTKVAPITYGGVRGAAHLIDGFHRDAWQVGVHCPGTGFAHEALIQTGAPVTIWRDTNQDFEESSEPIQSGWFGINIHRSAPYGDASTIANYSAGCVVFKNGNDFNEFMQIVKTSERYKNNHGCKFSLFIINKSWF